MKDRTLRLLAAAIAEELWREVTVGAGEASLSIREECSRQLQEGAESHGDEKDSD